MYLPVEPGRLIEDALYIAKTHISALLGQYIGQSLSLRCYFKIVL